MSASDPPPGRAVLWIGRILSVLVGLFLLMSAVMKFFSPPEVVDGFAHLGLPIELLTTIAALELASAILYLIPHSAVLGAILITGYMGGAIVTHLRIGEPVGTNVAIAVVAWLGIFLRDPRLRALLPLCRV